MEHSEDGVPHNPILPLNFGHKPKQSETVVPKPEIPTQEEPTQELPNEQVPIPVIPNPVDPILGNKYTAHLKPDNTLSYTGSWFADAELPKNPIPKKDRKMPPQQPGYPPFDPYTVEGYNDDSQMFYLNRRRGEEEYMTHIPDEVLIRFEVIYKQRWFLPASFYMTRETLIPRYLRWLAKNPDKKII